MNGGLGVLFDRAGTPMLLADDSRRCLDANPAACELLGLSRSEILERRIDDLLAAETAADVDALWDAFLRVGTQGGKVTLRTRAGYEREGTYSATANIEPGVHLSIFVAHVAEVPTVDEPATHRAKVHGGDSGQTLTPRQREVVTMLALGLTGEQIAERLVLSPETIRIHIRNARARLGARTRPQMIALALQAGELDVGP
jgi:PAS domain S-box-containing protein